MQDLTGRQYGKLQVLEFVGFRKSWNRDPAPFYRCRCTCGAVYQGHSSRDLILNGNWIARGLYRHCYKCAPMRAGIRIDYDASEKCNPWRTLANAIITQAAIDLDELYREREQLDSCPLRDQFDEDIKNLEEWFAGDEYKLFANINQTISGADIAAKVKENAYREMRWRKIRKEKTE